jgi:transposase
VKDGVEIVRILEAFDLMRSFRGAAKVAGCDHHTVKRLVALRDAGALSLEATPARAKAVDAFVEHIEGWMEQSQGRVRADVCFEKLVALGFSGSARTTRRAVAIARRLYRQGRVRVYRPWLPEPGLWLQFDWGAGPLVEGRATSLFCAWLAWSRYRVVIPAWDRSLGTLVLCLDRTFRELQGGVPRVPWTPHRLGRLPGTKESRCRRHHRRIRPSSAKRPCALLAPAVSAPRRSPLILA